jgi:hypothetical protein
MPIHDSIKSDKIAQFATCRSQQSGRSVKLTAHRYLVPNSGMRGAIPPLIQKSSWRSTFYSFLTSAIDGVSGQRHIPAALYLPGNDPGTHWIERWVGLRAALDTKDRGNTFFLCRRSNPGRLIIQSIVRPHLTTCVVSN